MVRAATPRANVERLSAEIGKALQSPDVRDLLGKQGMNVGNMNPDQYDAYIRNEMARNEKILKKLNLKLD